jgi:hypothetical protein
VQALLQAPQCAVVFVRLVSQPLAKLPSQLPQPEAQEMEQDPLVQLGVPLLLPQTTPHPPQWFRLLLVSASQPSPYRPLQFKKVPRQLLIAQVPVEQMTVALGAEHALPQLPQCEMLVLMLVSQPSVTPPVQSSYPAAHVIEQAPALQDGVPWLLLQTAPHALQLFGSVLRFISQPSLTVALQLS